MPVADRLANLEPEIACELGLQRQAEHAKDQAQEKTHRERLNYLLGQWKAIAPTPTAIKPLLRDETQTSGAAG